MFKVTYKDDAVEMVQATHFWHEDPWTKFGDDDGTVVTTLRSSDIRRIDRA